MRRRRSPRGALAAGVALASLGAACGLSVSGMLDAPDVSGDAAAPQHIGTPGTSDGGGGPADGEVPDGAGEPAVDEPDGGLVEITDASLPDGGCTSTIPLHAPCDAGCCASGSTCQGNATRGYYCARSPCTSTLGASCLLSSECCPGVAYCGGDSKTCVACKTKNQSCNGHGECCSNSCDRDKKQCD